MYKNTILILGLPFLILGFMAHFVCDMVYFGWKLFDYLWEVTK